jgi:hypothetical protein
MQRIKGITAENFDAMSNMMMNSFGVAGEEERASVFRSGVNNLYANLMAKKRLEVAHDESRRAWKFGEYL